MVKQQVVKEEQIGFHKGSLSTLAKEREELLKMVSVVEQLMQMHIKGLKELGVDLVDQAKKLKSSQIKTQKEFKNIDELI